MKPVVFDGLSSRSKLADRDFQFPIDNSIFRGPSVGLFVEKKPTSSRKPEHWQDSPRSQSFTKCTMSTTAGIINYLINGRHQVGRHRLLHFRQALWRIHARFP